jgi:hypothetical protein
MQLYMSYCTLHVCIIFGANDLAEMVQQQQVSLCQENNVNLE